MSKENQINIFIVEDNQVFTLALKADIETAFKNLPVKISSFETGEACMEKFKSEKAQVVILDYNLNSTYPNAANGIQVLDWLKKENPEINVIMLTSEDSIDIASKSFKHGAADYVVKTETKFRKINYSLSNLFKVMEAKTEAKKYKRILMMVFAWVTLLIIATAVIKVCYPHLLS
ncbi:MAG TPA: response regulator [Bacteroidia bacterium]|jgi:DNA-binding NtrC family response regulator|nr:response regulator [Bacteroidia bacterium]